MKRTGVSRHRRRVWQLSSGAILFAAILLWLRIDGEDPIPVGSVLPPLALRTPRSFVVVTKDSSARQVIMLFHWGCAYCRRQLGLLDQHLDELQGVRLILISTEQMSDLDSVRGFCPRLVSSSDVIGGILEGAKAHERFGNFTRPLFLFIDREGRVREKRSGVTPVTKIVSVLGRI